jgi:hypothetical protein
MHFLSLQCLLMPLHCYKSWSNSFRIKWCALLYLRLIILPLLSDFYSSLLFCNVFPSTLFPNNFSHCTRTFFDARDQFSQAYKRQKYQHFSLVKYLLFSDTKRNTTYCKRNNSSLYKINWSLITCCLQVSFFSVVLKYVKFCHIFKGFFIHT